MAGNQSRGLIQASKTRGWDPTVIPGEGSILPNFDRDQGNLAGKPVGELPGGPVDAWQDGYAMGGLQLDANAKPTFNSPTLKENVSRRTRNADPTPNMPGA